MKYKNALPYFPEEDINNILLEVKEILSGQGFLTKGPKSKKFETNFADYIGSRFAVSTNSCTTAMEVVLKAIGLTSLDEVVVPVQTFVATGSCVLNVGGKLVFCDCDENFLLDFNDLKNKITPATKAVIIVHFAGLIHPDILEIKKFLKEKNIYLIEDCAHSTGAKFGDLFAGNLGDFGCHSFYSTKIMTTGEGGMITTNDENAFHQCSSIRSIGIDTKNKVEVFTNVGSNNRMPEFESILGLYQLNRLEEFITHRIKIANVYKEELNILKEKGLIEFQKTPENIRHPYWKFIIFIKSERLYRDNIKERLVEFGINIDSPYNPLMHLQPVFKSIFGTKEGDFLKSETLTQTHFCLPIHVQISVEDAKNISQILIRVVLHD